LDDATQKEYWFVHPILLLLSAPLVMDVNVWMNRIVRNSFGSFWGENGFFNIIMHKIEYNLGIELFCQWAVPIVDENK
jgi:hypothetical protein